MSGHFKTQTNRKWWTEVKPAVSDHDSQKTLGRAPVEGGLQSGSGEATLHHDHYHPAASITGQTPAAYRGNAKGQLYFGKLAAAVPKCSSCSFSVSTTDTTTALQWDCRAPGTLGNNQLCTVFPILHCAFIGGGTEQRPTRYPLPMMGCAL